ncbi:MAG: zf-HC2 domain-containing protein, partial [Ktedonobacterales bacterium]
MSTNITNHRTDWEAQRERLSAYIDGRLPAAERAALEQHLPTCARCANELAELRRTVALLRALPTPALPRSFALPTRPRVATTAGAPRPAASRSVPRWAAAAQWAGGLAAAAGLILVLGSALGGALQVGERAASNAAAGGTTASAPYNPTGPFAGATPTRNDAEHPAIVATPPLPTCATTITSPSGTGTPLCNAAAPGATASPAATPTDVGHKPESFCAAHTKSAARSPPVLPLTGGGLAIG